MEEQGLGQSMMSADPRGQAGGGRGMGGQGQDIEQVLMMLQEGKTPEELMAMGISPELIEQAMMILQRQMAASQNAPQGLGGMMAQQGGM